MTFLYMNMMNMGWANQGTSTPTVIGTNMGLYYMRRRRKWKL